MKKGFFVFLVVLLAIPVVCAIGTEYSVCGSGCDYTAITDCLDDINGSDGSCTLDDADTTYTISSAKTYGINSSSGNGAIVANADGVTLDCNGAKLIGQSTNNYGIKSFGKINLEIKNCEITGYGTGVYLESVDNSVITANKLNNNSNTGLTVWTGANNIIRNNVLAFNNYGIYVTADSVGNTVANNSVEFNGAGGAFIYDSYGSRLENNTIINNTYGMGVILQSSNNSIVKNNIIDHNGQEGVSILQSTASGNKIINNSIRYNNFNGVYIWTSSHDNLIENNTISYSTYGNGVFIDVSDSNIIKNNIISFSGYGGTAHAGMVVHDSSNTQILGNEIFNNTENGITLDNSGPVDMSGNNIYDNVNYGVYAYSSDGHDNNVITGNTFTSNGLASATEQYLTSNFPRRWNGINWDNTYAGEHTGMFYFYSYGYDIIVNYDDTYIGNIIDGTFDLNLALINSSDFDGYATAIFDDSVATNCGELEDWLYNDYGVSEVTCYYFEPSVLQNNGAGNDYTANFNSSTTRVPSFSLPSLVNGTLYNGGGLEFGGKYSNNTISSNTFNSNAVGAKIEGLWGSDSTVTFSDNAFSNNIAAFFIPSDIVIDISSMSVASVPGNYNIDRIGSAFGASNSHGEINWDIPIMSMTKDFGSNLHLGDRFVSLNADELGSLNKLANVTINSVNCAAFDLYYYVGFASDLATIIGSGTIVATQANIGGDCTDNSICKNVACSGGTLTFEAQHFDGFGAGGPLVGNGTYSNTGNVSINLTSEISIMVTFNINFGSGRVEGDNDSAVLDSSSTAAVNGSWAFDRQYFLINNDGTVNETINVTSDRNAAEFIGGTSPEYKVKGIVTEGGACAGTLQSSYFEILNTTQNLCSLLRFGVAFDQFNVSARLLIPSDAAPGKKESTITFTAKKA